MVVENKEVVSFHNKISVLTREASTGLPEYGNWILDAEAHNLVVTSGRVLMSRLLDNSDTAFVTGITFCAVGTDTATVALADTTIIVETARNPITRFIRTTNVTQYRTFYAAVDVTAVLRKTGLFGHSSASSSSGTGEMFNSALINLDNSAGTRDVTVVHEITIGSS